MSKCLIIIGASGHGKVIADIGEKNGYAQILFLDDLANIFYCLISKKERFSIMEYILCRYL